MAQWLNSPAAAWAFLYLGETVRRDDTMVRSPIFGDSGCCVFNNAGQKGISALTVTERDLHTQLNTIDCVRSGQSVNGWDARLDEILAGG